MNNRNLMYLTIMVLIAMGLLLVVNITTLFTMPKPERYIGYNDVRGMAIEHQKLLYTLNFDQQNDLIKYFNMALPINKDLQTVISSSVDFSKLVIYRFNQPDLIITPIAYEDDNLIFKIPEWNEQGYLQDISQGSLKELISSTYDP
jgi:hypothetical protein